MPQKNAAQLTLFEVEEYLKTAPCVPLLRQKVAEWRDAGYPGATQVTQRLLNWWFANDHRLPDGRPFAYHRAQRDAIETLIYVYEVARIRTRRQLYEQFARTNEADSAWHQTTPSRASATKMATGSGKTKVMSLAIVWQYLQCAAWAAAMITMPAPILIRRAQHHRIGATQAQDFAGGRIFQTRSCDATKHLRFFWDVETVVRGDRRTRADAERLDLAHEYSATLRPPR